MTEPHVLTHIRDSIGIIELNRPEKFNCLSLSLLSGLESSLDLLESDPNVRTILIKARGRHFCTGADLEEVSEARKDRQRLASFLEAGHRVFARLEGSPLPVVAEVQGLCLAGGLELMMACDVVFAGQSAQFGCQHAKYGLVPGFGGTQRLTALTGLRSALDLMFSARWITAQEALERGLITHVADDEGLLAAAEAYCAKLAKGNPAGLSLMKKLGRIGIDRSIAQGLADECDAAVAALMSDNVTEGLAAFREHREPSFR